MRRGSAWSSTRVLTALVYLSLPLWGGMVKAQPPADLDPADTEGIIAAFLSDAADQQWDDEAICTGEGTNSSGGSLYSSDGPRNHHGMD